MIHIEDMVHKHKNKIKFFPVAVIVYWLTNNCNYIDVRNSWSKYYSQHIVYSRPTEMQFVLISLYGKSY